MIRLKRAWKFAVLFLVSPSQAADACLKKEAVADGLRVYAVFALAELISSRFDPLAFLDPTAPVLPPHGFWFWTRVAFWEPALFALSVFFTVLVLEWMREGWLPLKTAAATLWAALPAALAVYYASPSMPLGKGFFIAALAVWLVPAVAFSRRVPAERWRRVGAFLLGLNAVQIVCLGLEFATVVPLRSIKGFYVLSGVSILWLLVCVGIGLRKLYDTSAARVVLGFLFAILVGSVVPALAYLLGLMPKEVLKVVLYV